MPPDAEEPDGTSRPERGASPRSARPPAMVGRGRVVAGVLIALLFILLVSLRGIAGFYTDALWFRSLGFAEVWNRMVTTKVALSLVGGLAFFVLCWGNLLIAERMAPVFRPTTGDDDIIERYHEVVGRRAWLVRFGVAMFLALIIGASLGASWNEWILFTNGGSFGQTDATFHTDVGFYVFKLPFLLSATSWLFSILLVVFIITVLAHVVNGGIRFHTQLDRVTPQVKAHLSVLLAVPALVQFGRYWLSRYELVFSTRGTVDGATYTDVNVELRAIYLLMLIALFAVGLFIANIWRRGWVLPGMAVGLWVLVAVLASGVVPAFVQRFRVQPTESSMEQQYIAHNIEATRAAYDLGQVDQNDFDWTGNRLSASTMEENVGTLDNVRLWDPATMLKSVQQRQKVKDYYALNDFDVDRYEIDGQPTEVMIAARDLNTNGSQSWEATHLTYTHGKGVVAATANDQTGSGSPDLIAKNIPSTTAPGAEKLDVSQPRIYIGEDKTGYVIVNAKPSGSDRQAADASDEPNGYQGDDGVTIGSGTTGFLRKAAFSLRFGDINPMISASVTPQSKVMIERDVTSRVHAVAPFLAYDHDPYVVVDKGRIKYVLDAYTTSANFPNAQRADTSGLPAGSGLAGRSFNYARNSVKAVVDAYDGTVDLYVVDPEDPIIQAYAKAFPDLFSPASDMSEELGKHLRYPEDLFTVQTQMWAKYHVADAVDFYNKSDEWSVPRETGAVTKSGEKTTSLGSDGQEVQDTDRYPSQYVLMQLPGEDEPSFVLMRPYVTSTGDSDAGGSANQLRAFIVANSDPDSYGEIRTYQLASANPPDGPNLAANDIRADAKVADEVKSLCSQQTCTFSAPQILPVGNSLLYVQSLFAQSGKEGAPHLEHVLVMYQRPDDDPEYAIDSSLYGALHQLFGDDVPLSVQGGAGSSDPTADPGTPTDPGDEPTGTLTEQEGVLIDQIVKAFADADKAARAGDQVTYAEKIKEAGALATELQDLRERSGSPKSDGPTGNEATTTTTTPTPTPPATTTTSPKSTSTTAAGT